MAEVVSYAATDAQAHGITAPRLKFCLERCRRILHTLAVFLVSLSALMYLSAATGVWSELSHTADVLCAAEHIAVNGTEGTANDPGH
jgi:hypothetical protein